MPIQPYQMIEPVITAATTRILKDKQDEEELKKYRSNMKNSFERDRKNEQLELENKRLKAEAELDKVNVDPNAERFYRIYIGEDTNCIHCQHSKFFIKFHKYICLKKLEKLSYDNCFVTKDNICKLFQKGN